MILVALFKYLNCAVDKAFESFNKAFNTNYRKILLMMLFTTTKCKPLKTDPSREICAYTN